MVLKNYRYVFAIARGDEVELFADERSLPSNVTSTDVRRAKSRPGEMITFRGQITMGHLPIQGK
jgi:hypothetical protein